MMWTSVIKPVVWVCAMGAALFVAAGTLYGSGGWIFMGEMVMFRVAGVIWLAKCDPGLLKDAWITLSRRARPSPTRF